ncbi:MAG: chromosomal replication initiator protein DnaA, partial [Magnetococcales bacterium]|nr:chromosomal replication initiator protein DnaA [Magnetococcales bacterium]
PSPSPSPAPAALDRAASSFSGGEDPPLAASRPAHRRELDAGLDTRFTFETFVVGASNQFVHAAARRVADEPASQYNPLFIYGGVGLGKTHIMQAIGHHARSRRPGAKVLYITAERFMTQFINFIRWGRMPEFKETYRSLDLLLIDDIQVLSGKEQTQEEFFHTFNALFESGRQIVIASDRYPHEIEHLEDRLRSRFGSGLVADIQPPELETRIAILQKKAMLEGVRLSEEVALYLASAIQTNVRELEGALIRVSAFSSLTGQPMTLTLAKNALKEIVKGQEKVVTLDAIIKMVASFYKIRPADMRSDKRSRVFSHPRQVAMYLSKQMTTHSYPEIGHQFGGKDHTTVLHAVRRIEEKRQLEPTLNDELETLKLMLRK